MNAPRLAAKPHEYWDRAKEIADATGLNALTITRVARREQQPGPKVIANVLAHSRLPFDSLFEVIGTQEPLPVALLPVTPTAAAEAGWPLEKHTLADGLPADVYVGPTMQIELDGTIHFRTPISDDVLHTLAAHFDMTHEEVRSLRGTLNERIASRIKEKR